jgi:hypothetical protein
MHYLPLLGHESVNFIGGHAGLSQNSASIIVIVKVTAAQFNTLRRALLLPKLDPISLRLVAKAL